MKMKLKRGIQKVKKKIKFWLNNNKHHSFTLNYNITSHFCMDSLSFLIHILTLYLCKVNRYMLVKIKSKRKKDLK